MRILENQSGVQAPSTDYPKGRVQNNQTDWQESIVGDWVQMIQKMVAFSGITENDLPDNETNGYQILEALDIWIAQYSKDSQTIDIATSSNQNVGSTVGILEVNNSGTAGTTFINLPSAVDYRNFGKTIAIHIDCASGPGGDEIQIRDNGNTILTRLVEDGWIEYVEVKCDGVNWYVTQQNVQGGEVYPGVWKKIDTENEITLATTTDKVIVPNFMSVIYKRFQIDDADISVVDNNSNALTLSNTLTDLQYQRIGKEYTIRGAVGFDVDFNNTKWVDITLSNLPANIDTFAYGVGSFESANIGVDGGSCSVAAYVGTKNIQVKVHNTTDWDVGITTVFINISLTLV